MPTVRRSIAEGSDTKPRVSPSGLHRVDRVQGLSITPRQSPDGAGPRWLGFTASPAFKVIREDVTASPAFKVSRALPGHIHRGFRVRSDPPLKSAALPFARKSHLRSRSEGQ